MGFLAVKKDKRVRVTHDKKNSNKQSKGSTQLISLANFVTVSKSELESNRCRAYDYVM